MLVLLYAGVDMICCVCVSYQVRPFCRRLTPCPPEANANANANADASGAVKKRNPPDHVLDVLERYQWFAAQYIFGGLV